MALPNPLCGLAALPPVKLQTNSSTADPGFQQPLNLSVPQPAASRPLLIFNSRLVQGLLSILAQLHDECVVTTAGFELADLMVYLQEPTLCAAFTNVDPQDPSSMRFRHRSALLNLLVLYFPMCPKLS